MVQCHDLEPLIRNGYAQILGVLDPVSLRPDRGCPPVRRLHRHPVGVLSEAEAIVHKDSLDPPGSPAIQYRRGAPEGRDLSQLSHGLTGPGRTVATVLDIERTLTCGYGF